MKTRKKCMYFMLLITVLLTAMFISKPVLTREEAVLLKNTYCELNDLDPDKYYVSKCWDGMYWDIHEKGVK